MFTRTLPLALAGCLLAGAAVAQNAPPTRVRGTIAGMEGSTMTVTTREGPKVEVLLTDPLNVVTVKKVELADVKAGSYVGIASRTGAGGKDEALEVLVFPEAMRGVGEGHRPWDLEPGSMMTNAAVTEAMATPSGRDLKLTYKDGSNDIAVPAGTLVFTFAPAERGDLKAGEKVVIFAATKNAEGKLATNRVTVSKDGVAPPM